MSPDRQPKQRRSVTLSVKYANGRKQIRTKNTMKLFEKNLDVKIDRSTVSKILKEKNKWKAVVSAEVSTKTFRYAVLF